MADEKPLAETMAELRKLDAEATPRPWAWDPASGFLVGPERPRTDAEWVSGEGTIRPLIATDEQGSIGHGPDRDLLPAMRNALPRILDALAAVVPGAANDPPGKPMDAMFDSAARYSNELERKLAEANRVGKMLAVLVERMERSTGQTTAIEAPPHTPDREWIEAAAEARKQGWLP